MATSRPAARRPCRSRRALALRCTPLWPDFDPADERKVARLLRERLNAAYRDGGREALALELSFAIDEVTHCRATTTDERRVVRAWARYTFADAFPAWLATAYADGWPCPV